jgi:hypothetical protein
MIAQFTIRDVCWLTLLAALALGWWLDRNRLASQCAEAQRQRAAAERRAARAEAAAAGWVPY